MLIAALLAFTLTPTPPKSPEFHARYEASFNYEAINPTSSKVEFMVNCGPEYQPLSVVLDPGTKEQLKIADEQGRLSVACFLTHWRKVK